MPYGSWLLKFAVSISWRGLTFLKITEEVEPKLSHLKSKIDDPLNCWHDFLSGKSSSPGKYPQHLIPIQINPNPKNELDVQLNKYLEGTVNFGLVEMGEDLIQHTKLGRIGIVGVVDAPSWKGVKVSRLKVRKGIIPDDRYNNLPMSYRDTLHYHVANVLEGSKGLSQKQREKIDRDSLEH